MTLNEKAARPAIMIEPWPPAPAEPAVGIVGC
jgi:hypothetical protein